MDQSIFEKGLRVRTHAPCELSHVSLTALARSAQRTGFYVRSFDALSLGGAVTILTGMTADMHNLAVRTHCTCLLNPKCI